MPIRVIDTITPRGDFPVVLSENLGGAFIKSVDLAGNVLVLTVQGADGAEASFRFTGAVQAGTFTRRAGIRAADSAFVAADFTVESDHESISLPGSAADVYLGFWQPTTALVLTDIRIQGNPQNSFNMVEGPYELTIGGVDGYYWRSLVAGPTVVPIIYALTSTSHLRVFRRYAARVAAASPTDPIHTFVPADFAVAGHSVSSLIPRIGIPGYLSNLGELHWLAYAVPDDTPDIIDAEGDQGFRLGTEEWINQFTKQAGTISLDGTPYKVWVENTQQTNHQFHNFYSIIQ